MADKAVIISTQDDAFLGIHDGGNRSEVRPLGLGDKGTVKAIIHDHKQPKRLYAATLAEGVWRSDDAGRSWHEINRGVLYRHGFSLIQHPQTGHLYYGTQPASIFKSTDYGESWKLCDGLEKLRERIEWTFPNPPHVAHVRGLGICVSDPDVIYGAVEEGWVVRSTDRGETWSCCKQGSHFDAHSVTVMPDNPKVLIETAGRGAFRSEDGGESFVSANTGLEHTYLAPLAVHPDKPNVVFTAGAAVPPPGWRRPEGPGCGFYRSDDQGRSWQRCANGLPGTVDKGAPRALTGDPEQWDRIYMGTTTGEVWMTADGGQSFRGVFSGLPAIHSLHAAPASVI
jgi:photosystem II stability/assembly factor-like uncharacterized protein